MKDVSWGSMENWYGPNQVTYFLAWKRNPSPKPGESSYFHHIEVTIYLPQRKPKGLFIPIPLWKVYHD